MSKQFSWVLLTASLTLTLIVSVPRFTQAQLQIGVKAGLAVTNFTGDPDTEWSSKVAFTGGFPFSFAVSRNLFLQPELLYVVKGATTTETVEGLPLDLNFSITYIEIPGLVKYSVSPRSSISPIIKAGPVISWNIDSRVRFKVVGSELEFNEADDSIAALDYGVAFGGGVDVKWDLRTITFEARYTMGLTNLIDNDDDPKKNGVLTVTAGIGL